MNTFGTKLRLTTFGESHGAAIGGILDGFVAGVKIDTEFIQAELDKRRPGRNKYATARDEADKIEIFSGVFEGVSTGTPIGFAIFNSNQKSNDYENLREIFRPGHADFAYFAKYGVRDHRGGGRASARETAVRVAAGAFAQLLLNHFNISVQSGVLSVGDVMADTLDWQLAAKSEIFALGNEDAMKNLIMQVREQHDSIGASVLTIVDGAPAGLGEGLYDKLDARLAAALMGINGVKAVEIGEGVNASRMRGSENNDEIVAQKPFDASLSNVQNSVNLDDVIISSKQNFTKNATNFSELLNSPVLSTHGINGEQVKFLSNHAGGVLGGMSSGAPIVLKSHFKPTPSIFKAQQTINLRGEDENFELRGRHDPCIGVRGSVVATAMVRLVVADMMLLNASANLENLKKIYN